MVNINKIPIGKLLGVTEEDIDNYLLIHPKPIDDVEIIKKKTTSTL